MMNVVELRVGNLVTSKTWKGSHVVRGIHQKISESEIIVNGFTHTVKPGIFCEIEPVPITEEWLFKFGFRWSESLELFMMWESITIFETVEGEEDSALYSIHFYHNGDHVIVESNNEHGEYSNLKFKHIKYVHQLQNLYFALTGEELTIQEKNA